MPTQNINLTIDKNTVGLGNLDNTSDTNKPVSSATQTALNLKLNLTGGSLSGALNEVKWTDIASATLTDLGSANGNYGDVTGTTTITGLGTIQAGASRKARFTGSLTITYNATSLILPGAANITTTAGDIATFTSLGSGNWICTSYQSNETGAWTTWVPTYTGFSADPTSIVAKSTLMGKTCHASLFAGSTGTSNAVTLTFTMPYTAANTQFFFILVVNNGTVQQGRLSMTAGSNVGTVKATPAGGSFTNGAANIDAVFTYEIQ